MLVPDHIVSLAQLRYVGATRWCHTLPNYNMHAQVDLNGDGKPEFVAVAPEGRVILAAPKKHGDGFAPALVLAELSTRDIANLKEDEDTPEVLAVTSGSLDMPRKDYVRRPRKQVVAIVMSNGMVALLDSNLKVRWRARIPNIRDPVDLKDVSVLVTPHSGVMSDSGIVVVSVREFAEEDDDDYDYEEDAEEEEKHEHGREKDEKLSEVDSDPRTKSRHVSYFAFGGATGHIAWSHTPDDFHKDPMMLVEPGVKTLYSERLKAELLGGIHYGEHSCRDYRESILASLPHGWFGDADSSIHVAHFHMHRKHHGSQRHNLGSAQTDTEGSKMNSPPSTHFQWKTSVKGKPLHKMPPNVIVSHVEDGLEIMHLFSGRPVCRLRLSKKALHADINGDGVPDHVHVSGGIPKAERIEMDIARRQFGHEKMGPCMTRVTSGIPPSTILFNGSICSLAVTNRPQGSLDIAPPVAIPVPRKNGHYATNPLHQKMNLFYFNSRGEIISYDHKGDRVYSIHTGITWRQKYPQFDSDALEEDEQDDDYDAQDWAVPTFAPFSFRKHAIPSGVIAAGRNLLTILSEQGRELWSVDLPSPPVQQVVQTDYNMDGYTDIILVTDSAMYAWTQVRTPGGVSISALVGGLIVVMLVILVTQHQLGSDTTSAVAKGRSTDRVD